MVPRWRDNRAPGGFYRLHTVRAIAERSRAAIWRPRRDDLRKSTVIGGRDDDSRLLGSAAGV